MSGRLTFSGHATVAVDLAGQRIVTDPLLGRHVQHFLRVQSRVPATAYAGADAVLISHIHHDHLDLPSLRRFDRGTLIICPAGAEDLIADAGFRNVVPLGVGASATVGAVEVRAVEAAHDGNRAFSRAEVDPLGYLIDGSRRIYFAGDTDLFDGMERLDPEIDVALVPIWGWGPKLGSGHLDPESAATAVAMLAPRLAVPIHWGSLAPIGSRLLWPRMLTDPVQRFLDAMAERAPAIEVRVLQPGEALDLESVGR